jgi:hypothetical protein
MLVSCAVVAVLAAVGCESVPLGQTFHKADAVPQGKATVYLFRPSMQQEWGVVFDVEANGVAVVGLADGSYYPYVADPGLVTFKSGRSGEKTSELPIRVEAGKSYYVQLVPVSGVFRFRPELTQMHEQAAEPKITGCRQMLK